MKEVILLKKETNRGVIKKVQIRHKNGKITYGFQLSLDNGGFGAMGFGYKSYTKMSKDADKYL